MYYVLVVCVCMYMYMLLVVVLRVGVPRNVSHDVSDGVTHALYLLSLIHI